MFYCCSGLFDEILISVHRKAKKEEKILMEIILGCKIIMNHVAKKSLVLSICDYLWPVL